MEGVCSAIFVHMCERHTEYMYRDLLTFSRHVGKSQECLCGLAITQRHPSNHEQTQTTLQDTTMTYHFFWKARSPFSQWHPSPYILDGITFRCAEQGMMMYGKAIMFGDHAVAQRMLKAKHTRQMKAIGSCVQNFDQNVWQQLCRDLVYAHNHAKNIYPKSRIASSLVAHATSYSSAEASPYDCILGIGLKRTRRPPYIAGPMARSQQLVG